MAQFAINTPVASSTPVVEVSVAADKPLPLGRQRFRLTVTDDSGNVSAGDEVVVIVADQERPTAVLQAPSVVGFGKSFNLDGSRSFDIGGGKVVRWEFTYLGPQL